MKASYGLYFLTVTTILIVISIGVIFLAKGYRYDTDTNSVHGTGIAVINSTPDSALIYINGVPKDATNASVINLNPGQYEVSLEKEGFSPWRKTILIEQGLVTKVDALLIPLFPTLQPLTFTGVTSPHLSPNGQKIVYSVTTGESAGVWLIDLEERPFNLSRNPELLLKDTPLKQYSLASIQWAPDGSSLLLTYPANDLLEETYELFDLRSNKITSLPDKTAMLTSWEKIRTAQNNERLLTLNEQFVLRLQELDIVSWSPSEEYVLYKKVTDDTIEYYVMPTDIIPIKQTENPTPTPATDFSRPIIKMPVGTNHSLVWYPDSAHIIITTETGEDRGQIEIIEITGTNRTQVFSGPIKDLQTYPNLNGSKILTLTRFNPESEMFNLYSINLR